MATGSPPEVARVVVELAASRAPTLGEGRLICVDGPAGSGKTTLGRAIAEQTGARIINTDELMEGWGGFDTVTAQLTAVVSALADGRTGEYHRFLWGQGHFDDAVTRVEPGPWLVVEGVGSGEPAIAEHITALVWVEVDDDLRLARGLERDGHDMEPEWREFMPAEREIFVRDRTFERADVLVDGTGSRVPVTRP